MGDPVDVADALKDLAPSGHIYVGGEVAPRDARGLRVPRARAARAQGRARRAAASSSCCREQEHLHRARIGAERRVFSRAGRPRARARARCARALRALRDGQGGIVSVMRRGGPRQVAPARRARAQRRGRGHALAARAARSRRAGSSSFHPIADLLRSWSEISDEDDDAGARGKLDAAIRARRCPDERGRGAARSSPRCSGCRSSRTTARGSTGCPATRSRSCRCAADRSSCARAARCEPLVVVMDDLHWADLSSIELLRAAAAASARSTRSSS